MYTLRFITNDNVEVNYSLGINYKVVDKEKSPKEFEKNMNIAEPINPKDVYRFVVNEDGSHIFALYKKGIYCIMTDNGKMFDDLSFE